MITGALLLIYYLLMSAGLFLAADRVLARSPMFSVLTRPLRVLLGAGLAPVFITWLAFIGVFRAPGLVEALGGAAAAYAVYAAWHHRAVLKAWLKAIPKIYYALALVALATLFYSHWCYLEGGVNNWPWDELRGLSMTSAFAANHLRPAHPLDFSIPISYGYYFFEYTAFLYAAVNGYSFPAITLLASKIVAIVAFYVAFAQMLTRLFPAAPKSFALLGILIISFYGLDFQRITPESYHLEWWNATQITQMASIWNFLYHYLAAAAFAFAATACMHDALAKRDGNSLACGALFSLLVPVYATVTGVFMGASLFLAMGVYILLHVKQGLLRWVCTASFRLLPFFVLMIVWILLPQVFTFVGREGYITLQSTPVMWFTRAPVSATTPIDWVAFLFTLWFELGPLHFFALLLAPVAVVMMWRSASFAAVYVGVLTLMTFASVTFVQAGTNDWYWRSGGFGIVVLTSIIGTWLISREVSRSKMHAAGAYGATLLFMMSGIYNFYAEQFLRHRACTMPSPEIINANRYIPLNTPLANIMYDNAWVFTAGRTAIIPNNATWPVQVVYSLPKFFLYQHFNWSTTAPCRATWYGSSLPGAEYVTQSSLAPPAFSYHTCEMQNP